LRKNEKGSVRQKKKTKGGVEGDVYRGGGEGAGGAWGTDYWGSGGGKGRKTKQEGGNFCRTSDKERSWIEKWREIGEGEKKINGKGGSNIEKGGVNQGK